MTAHRAFWLGALATLASFVGAVELTLWLRDRRYHDRVEGEFLTYPDTFPRVAP